MEQNAWKIVYDELMKSRQTMNNYIEYNNLLEQIVEKAQEGD